MRYDDEVYDMTSIGVVAVVSILAVLTIVLNLAPGAEASASGLNSPVGNAVVYGLVQVPVGTQFNARQFDFNLDKRLDRYDYRDVLDGRATCDGCDLNGDGFLDKVDLALLDALIVRLHDYNRNGVLDRDDPVFLREILLGNERCNKDIVCDLDGDGYVSKQDLTLFTSLLYNYG